MNLRHISKGALLLGIALGGCSHTSDLLSGITGKTDGPAAEAAAPAVSGSSFQNANANAAELGAAVKQAQLQRRAGDLNGATQTLSQLVLIAPDDPRVLGEYGKTLLDKGEIDDALAFLQRAGELAPTDWAIFSALGVAYSRSANYQGARASFTRALMLKPGDPTVLNNFAMTQIQAGDLAGAEALLTQAGINAADDTRIAENLALVRQLKAAGGAAPAAVASQAPAQLTSPPAPVASAPAAAAPTVAAAVPPAADVTGATLETAKPVRSAELPVIRSTPIGPSGPVQAAAPAPAAPRVAAPAQAPASVTIVPGRSTYVQVAAYNTEGKASELAGRLNGLAPKIMSGNANGQTFYRVRIGPLATSAEAASTLARVKALGFTDARFVSEAAAPAAPVAAAPRSGAPALRLSENAREPQ